MSTLVQTNSYLFNILSYLMNWHFPILVPYNFIIEGGVEVDADYLQLWLYCPNCEEKFINKWIADKNIRLKPVFACFVLRVMLVGSNWMFFA